MHVVQKHTENACESRTLYLARETLIDIENDRN